MESDDLWEEATIVSQFSTRLSLTEIRQLREELTSLSKYLEKVSGNLKKATNTKKKCSGPVCSNTDKPKTFVSVNAPQGKLIALNPNEKYESYLHTRNLRPNDDRNRDCNVPERHQTKKPCSCGIPLRAECGKLYRFEHECRCKVQPIEYKAVGNRGYATKEKKDGPIYPYEDIPKPCGTENLQRGKFTHFHPNDTCESLLYMRDASTNSSVSTLSCGLAMNQNKSKTSCHCCACLKQNKKDDCRENDYHKSNKKFLSPTKEQPQIFSTISCSPYAGPPELVHRKRRQRKLNLPKNAQSNRNSRRKKPKTCICPICELEHLPEALNDGPRLAGSCVCSLCQQQMEANNQYANACTLPPSDKENDCTCPKCVPETPYTTAPCSRTSSVRTCTFSSDSRAVFEFKPTARAQSPGFSPCASTRSSNRSVNCVCASVCTIVSTTYSEVSGHICRPLQASGPAKKQNYARKADSRRATCQRCKSEPVISLSSRNPLYNYDTDEINELCRCDTPAYNFSIKSSKPPRQVRSAKTVTASNSMPQEKCACPYCTKQDTLEVCSCDKYSPTNYSPGTGFPAQKPPTAVSKSMTQEKCVCPYCTKQDTLEVCSCDKYSPTNYSPGTGFPAQKPTAIHSYGSSVTQTLQQKVYTRPYNSSMTGHASTSTYGRFHTELDCNCDQFPDQKAHVCGPECALSATASYAKVQVTTIMPASERAATKAPDTCAKAINEGDSGPCECSSAGSEVCVKDSNLKSAAKNPSCLCINCKCARRPPSPNKEVCICDVCKCEFEAASSKPKGPHSVQCLCAECICPDEADHYVNQYNSKGEVCRPPSATTFQSERIEKCPCPDCPKYIATEGGHHVKRVCSDRSKKSTQSKTSYKTAESKKSTKTVEVWSEACSCFQVCSCESEVSDVDLKKAPSPLPVKATNEQHDDISAHYRDVEEKVVDQATEGRYVENQNVDQIESTRLIPEPPYQMESMNEIEIETTSESSSEIAAERQYNEKQDTKSDACSCAQYADGTALKPKPCSCTECRMCLNAKKSSNCCSTESDACSCTSDGPQPYPALEEKPVIPEPGPTTSTLYSSVFSGTPCSGECVTEAPAEVPSASCECSTPCPKSPSPSPTVTPVESIKSEPKIEVIEEPVCEKPVCKEPVCKEPVCREPICQEPVCKEPVCREPICREPVFVCPNNCGCDDCPFLCPKPKPRPNVPKKKCPPCLPPIPSALMPRRKPDLSCSEALDQIRNIVCFGASSERCECRCNCQQPCLQRPRITGTCCPPPPTPPPRCICFPENENRPCQDGAFGSRNFTPGPCRGERNSTLKTIAKIGADYMDKATRYENADDELLGINTGLNSLFGFLFSEIKNIKDMLNCGLQKIEARPCDTAPPAIEYCPNDFVTVPPLPPLEPCTGPAFVKTLPPECCTPHPPCNCLTPVVTITGVQSVGSKSLLITWKVAQCRGVVGYEVFVDGCLKSRSYSPARTCAVAYGVDLGVKHVVTVVAVVDESVAPFGVSPTQGSFCYQPISGPRSILDCFT